MSLITLDVAELRAPLARFLTDRLALHPDDADIGVDHMVRAEQSGKSSHGLIRVHYLATSGKFGPYGNTPAPAPGHPGPGRLHVDGKGHFGYALLEKMVRAGCDEARASGTCIATGSPVYPSGCLGDWARLAMKEGVGVVIMANSPRRVAAQGGRSPIVGTNAFCIGLPTRPHPFVADCASSEISHGALLVARAAGAALPPNSALDATGAPTTSAADVDPTKGLGALLPFGGSYKAFALAMGIELLACLGGGPPGEMRAGYHGVYCHFLGPDVMREHLPRLSEWLAGLDGTGTRIPGWTSGRRALAQSARNTVDVSGKTLDALQSLGLLTSVRRVAAATPAADGRPS